MYNCIKLLKKSSHTVMWWLAYCVLHLLEYKIQSLQNAQTSDQIIYIYIYIYTSRRKGVFLLIICFNSVPAIQRGSSSSCVCPFRVFLSVNTMSLQSQLSSTATSVFDFQILPTLITSSSKWLAVWLTDIDLCWCPLRPRSTPEHVFSNPYAHQYQVTCSYHGNLKDTTP